MNSNLNNQIFQQLTSKVECVTGTDLVDMGFEGTYRSYSINFQEENGVFNLVECVKKMPKGSKDPYFEFQLSEDQIDVLKGMVSTTADNIVQDAKDQDYNDQLEYDHRNWLQSACGSSMF